MPAARRNMTPAVPEKSADSRTERLPLTMVTAALDMMAARATGTLIFHCVEGTFRRLEVRTCGEIPPAP